RPGPSAPRLPMVATAPTTPRFSTRLPSGILIDTPRGGAVRSLVELITRRSQGVSGNRGPFCLPPNGIALASNCRETLRDAGGWCEVAIHERGALYTNARSQ